VLEDPFGAMQLVGVLEKNPTTSDEFLRIIDTAKELRSTESTAKNEQSSRSHAICRIRVVNKESPNSPEGTFLLVDLAGSEASADTQHHSRERMAETREINKSLTTLKDCIRARALWSIGRGEASQKHVHIPFRTSKLTQVLKSAFDVNNTQTCKTLVIACINPSILDVVHSKNTLRYAEMLKVPVPKAKPRPYDERIPTTWENKHVQAWITKNVGYDLKFETLQANNMKSGKPPINPLLLAPRENGLQFCRLQEDEFVGRVLLTPGVKPEQAKLLYYKLWALHIDSRALMNGPAAPNETKATDAALKKTRKTKAIKPGMFFRLNEQDIKDGVEILMAMGVDTAPKDRESDEVRWICSVVRPAPVTNGAYELFVAKQRAIDSRRLNDEVKLEYDIHTRYYLIKGS
jgi:kinesin family protein 2/24